MNEREWYSVKCVFEHDGFAEGAEETVYEERIVILRADNIDDALDLGEMEEREYAVSAADASTCYVGFISAYRTNETELADKMEVYSLMRQTSLSREDFFMRYYGDDIKSTPLVVTPDLDATYRQMALDENREREALEWSEAMMKDVAEETQITGS